MANGNMNNPASCESSTWYCIQTKPNEGKYAEFHLHRQNFKTFLPLVKSRRLYRYKLKWITSPMFPRYLFASVEDREQVLKIRSTIGVSKLVSFGHEPAIVPFDIISEIRLRCVNDVYVIEDPELSQGDEVAIIGGPYKGIDAIFDRSTSNERRVVILLEIMSTTVNVEIDRYLISKSG